MLPVPTLSYLAQFSGRPESSYGPFAEQALQQATLLFSLVAQIDEYPADADLQQLGINAILEMADAIYLEQPNAAINASPFTSETVGTYTYTRSTSAVATAASRLQPTGLFWWELALERLSAGVTSLVDSGGFSVFDNDSMYLLPDGRRAVLSPAELCAPTDIPFDINAELFPRPALG